MAELEYPKKELDELVKLSKEECARLASVNRAGIALQSLLEDLFRAPETDRRSLAMARVHLEIGMMLLRRAILKTQGI